MGQQKTQQIKTLSLHPCLSEICQLSGPKFQTAAIGDSWISRYKRKLWKI